MANKTLSEFQIDWAAAHCPVCKKRREQSKQLMRKKRGKEKKNVRKQQKLRKLSN